MVLKERVRIPEDTTRISCRNEVLDDFFHAARSRVEMKPLICLLLTTTLTTSACSGPDSSPAEGADAGGTTGTGGAGAGSGGTSGDSGGASGDSGGTSGDTGGASGATGGHPGDGDGDGGGDGTGGSDDGYTGIVEPGSYALGPPDSCVNQWTVPECEASCGERCEPGTGVVGKNACEGGKEGAEVNFACPRHMLFSPEMAQAVIDDGYEGKFNYAIVGHDPDTTGLDAGLPNSCCQCYQLVFQEPTYIAEQANLVPPKPLIVQSANTQASGPAGFDVFMGAGGFGVFNACSDSVPQGNRNGHYLYDAYPAVGQAFSGGVKPGPDSLACATDNALSDDLIGSQQCQSLIEAACNEMTSASEMVQEVSRQSCIQSNQPLQYYHENWTVLAQRVACPQHLMEVTGCKIPGDGLPAPEPAVQTAEQAVAAGFLGQSGGGQDFHTTTMQDCCMPTCAWANNVTVPTVDGYDSLYSCDETGAPRTE